METIVGPYARSGSDAEARREWQPATRVAFRFCFVYFGLYIITTQMLEGFVALLPIELPDLGTVPPARPLFLWIGRHILGRAELSAHPTTGSGDSLFAWVQAFSILLIAIIATLIWSAVARRKTEHAKLFAWFRLILRIGLGAQLLFYGFAKIIPTQMPVFDLARLVEPFGNFSSMGVLWSSVGAAPAYEIVLGCAEALGGLLLFFPATALVGAFVGLMDASMVFLVNMAYDVNVKLFSFHLVLISLVLIAPNARRLFDLLILHRVGSIRREPPVVDSPSIWRTIVIAGALYCAYLVVIFVRMGVHGWSTYGGGAPHSALFGIWNVDSMIVGGVARAPLLSDSTRWRRVIFQSPDSATVQRMDDTFHAYSTTIDSSARTLTLAPPRDSTKSKPVLAYRRVDHEHLLIDGAMQGRDIHLSLSLQSPQSFLQRRQGFHWVSELPFNR